MSPIMLSSRTVTARKSHPCATCNTTAIRPGVRYVRESYVHDGAAYTWVSCEPCWGISHLVFQWWSDDDGVSADEYAEWAQEHEDHPRHGEAARAYLARLAKADPTEKETQ